MINKKVFGLVIIGMGLASNLTYAKARRLECWMLGSTAASVVSGKIDSSNQMRKGRKLEPDYVFNLGKEGTVKSHTSEVKKMNLAPDSVEKFKEIYTESGWVFVFDFLDEKTIALSSISLSISKTGKSMEVFHYECR